MNFKDVLEKNKQEYLNRLIDLLKINSILDESTSVLDEFLQVGNFGGFPSITIPDGFIDNLPVGVNITGNCFDDQNVLNIAYALEGVMPYKNQIAKEVNNG